MNRNPVIVKEEQTLWGVINGKKVWQFCLENRRGTKLFVSNYGATAQALCLPDGKGGYDDLLLGYDNLAAYEQDEFYMGAVVGRYANRIGHGKVCIDGNMYRLAVREGGYHLHGGNQGFNKKLFQYHIPLQPEPASIAFSYESPDGEEGFPGRLRLEVTYTLDDDDCWTVEYKAHSDKTTIINLTQHAYFNLSGRPQRTVGQHNLTIFSPLYLPVNSLQLPTGELAPVAGTPFDFSTPKKIGAEWNAPHEQLRRSGGYDHSFVLEKNHSPAIKKVAMVSEPASGRVLEVFTTEPAVHFYAGNFLRGVSGKNGVVYGPRSGFCLETGHYPDAPNHAHFPSTVLAAGERFYSKTAFKFSRTNGTH